MNYNNSNNYNMNDFTTSVYSSYIYIYILFFLERNDAKHQDTCFFNKTFGRLKKS